MEVEINIMANLGTKLKALLAAGLIGTAGLGMQSCSNPSDSVYYPYTVEAPSTDTPGSGGGTENPGNGGGAENPNPSGGEENGGNGGETVEEVTFEKLGVKNPDVQRRIVEAEAHRFCFRFNGIGTGSFSINNEPYTISAIYEYKDSGFNKTTHASGEGFAYLCKNTENKYDAYYIPKDLKPSFDKAIAAYKVSQSNQ